MPVLPVIVNNTPLVALWVLIVVIDERKGRRYAQRLGLALTGTLGILLLAKQEGLIPVIAPLVEQLEQSGLHLGADLVQKVLTLAQEI